MKDVDGRSVLLVFMDAHHERYLGFGSGPDFVIFSLAQIGIFDVPSVKDHMKEFRLPALHVRPVRANNS